jgi:hypothetical protein
MAGHASADEPVDSYSIARTADLSRSSRALSVPGDRLPVRDDLHDRAALRSEPTESQPPVPHPDD